MLEQDFEKLLAAYFEDELDEAGLQLLHDTARKVPAHRRRFQRELRLHTLLRESALVMIDGGCDSLKSSIFLPKWLRKMGGFWVSVAAAVMLFCGGLALLNLERERAATGICLHVSNSQELIVWRGNKPLSMKKDQRLQVGDRLVSENHAQASLRLNGVGLLTIQGETELEILDPLGAVAVFVKRGEVLVEADKRAPGRSPVVFQTPMARVEIMGTVFGLEVDPSATRVQVHEGVVRFVDSLLGRSVDVESGKYCVNGGSVLEALDQKDLLPDTLMPGLLRLLPVDDACSEGERYTNGKYLKVERGRRVTVLKFDVPNLGRVLEARLQLTQMADPGSGTLRLWQADHDDWSELTLAAQTAPKPMNQIAEHHGWVSLNQKIELNVSPMIRKAGTYSMILTLDESGDKDIWFGSKESLRPPELILSYQPQ